MELVVMPAEENMVLLEGLVEGRVGLCHDFKYFASVVLVASTMNEDQPILGEEGNSIGIVLHLFN